MSASDSLFIVLGSDDRYAMPLSVTLYSTLRRLPADSAPVVMVVDAGITAPNRHRVERVISNAHPATDVEWVDPEVDQFADLRTTSWGSPASYLPLLIPALAPDRNRALYLDSDLLVRTDLTELWDSQPVGSATPLAAVRDFGFLRLADALKGDAAARLGLDGEAPYFNSGVMLMNLGVWRETQIPERAFEFARDHPDAMRFTDQDALNAVTQGDWHQLDERWNVLIGSIDRLIELRAGSPTDQEALRHHLLDDPHIVHFSGPQKPWKPGYRRTARAEYLAEVEKSGWFDTPSEHRAWARSRAMRSPFARAKRVTTKALWPAVVGARNLRARVRGQKVENRDD